MRLHVLSCFLPLLALAAGDTPRKPMPVDWTRTTNYRWANKPVLESRLLDDMENIATWTLENRGEGKGEMTLTAERARDGKNSLRLRAKTMGEKPGGTMGRPPGSASIVRKIGGEDWTRYNRISFWVYPDMPGFNNPSLCVIFHNEGGQRIPNLWKDGFDFVLVRNHQWNLVTSEIAHLARDKVTAVEIQYRLQGSEPHATDTASFDFDHLTLERVEPDYFEGWGVWPGRISFSHTGYQSGSRKSALASGLAAKEFRLIKQETGATVLTKPVRQVKTNLGEFQVMDFSEVREPGTYIIQAGDVSTQRFHIGPNVWRRTILEAINFFYAERCGYAVPGVHDVCHRDWMGVHGDKRVNINGGWHDAGDLSQGLVNTSEAVYSMFALAERLRARNEDPELYQRLVDEAKWGLDWVLKTTFHDGNRVTWATMDFWTNGILGDADDGTARATNSPYENFLAAASEAIAYRVLRRSDPVLAGFALKTAREDWRFAVEGMSAAGTGRRPAVVTELNSAGVLASLDLYRATGERQYADKALELAPPILESQQKSFMPGWKVPITGFFYTNPAKDRLLHYFHRGHEQGPIVAMARLCETFPNHPDWMKWYAAAALHSEYFLKEMAKFTQPYGMLPASVYKDDEYLQSPEGPRRDLFRAQIFKGIQVGPNHYLRLFPIWFDFRGNLGTMLSATKGLSEAAHLRGDLEAAELAQLQLQWTVGRNPFVQSLIYGEGYDYAPQYTAMSGDIVGSFPVGVQTNAERDVPYWASTNCHNWKEVWVHPASRWIWLMRDLAGPALVEGRSPSVVEFREAAGGAVTAVTPDFASGRFRAMLPEGSYTVSGGRSTTLLPGGTYTLDPALDFTVTKEKAGGGQVSIRVDARGQGAHRFAIRAHNLSVQQSELPVTLREGAAQAVTFRATVTAADAPWVAVVVPDGDVSRRKEVIGSARD